MKLLFFLAILVVLNVARLERVDGAGECGEAAANQVAFRMAPCASASQDANAQVSDRCCAVVKTLGQNPSCLCAVMLSDTAKSAGIKPQVAMTIPKRCNIANRPVGYKCGDYTLP